MHSTLNHSVCTYPFIHFALTHSPLEHSFKWVVTCTPSLHIPCYVVQNARHILHYALHAMHPTLAHLFCTYAFILCIYINSLFANTFCATYSKLSIPHSAFRAMHSTLAHSFCIKVFIHFAPTHSALTHTFCTSPFIHSVLTHTMLRIARCMTHFLLHITLFAFHTFCTFCTDAFIHFALTHIHSFTLCLHIASYKFHARYSAQRILHYAFHSYTFILHLQIHSTLAL